MSMKNWIAGSIIFLLAATVVLAQSANDLYNQAVNAGAAYRAAYPAFVQAKNQHLQYNTAATRVVAIEKTNTVLADRNNWLIAYLKYLRQTLADVTNIANYSQTVTFLDLEGQINSLSSLSLGHSDNFNQINAESKDWEKGLAQMDKLVQAAQLQIASTRLATYQGQLAGLVQKYQQDHATPSASQSTTLALVQQKLDASVAGREQMDKQLATYRTGSGAASTWTQALNHSHNQLLEAAQLLSQLLQQP